MIAFKFIATPRRVALLALDLLLLGMLLGWIVAPPHARIPPAQTVDLSALLADKLVMPAGGNDSLGDSYALLIGQPLFQEDRKYTPPVKVDAVAAQSPPPDYSVTGYLEIPGRPAKAFLRERSSGRGLTVVMGDSVEGWSVVGMTAKHVSLRQGARTEELSHSGAPVIVSASDENTSAPSASGTATAATATTGQPRAGTAAQTPNPSLDPIQPAVRPGNASLLVPDASVSPSLQSASRAQTTLNATLSEVTVNARRFVPGPPLLPAPQGPPRTYNSPPGTTPN